MRITLAHSTGRRACCAGAPRKKRAVNLFVDTELLDGARRLQINLSDTLEQRLRAIVKAEHERRWLEESKQAIDPINAFIDRHGLLASRLRYRPERE